MGINESSLGEQQISRECSTCWLSGSRDVYIVKYTSAVEGFLSQDRGVSDSSLIGVTVLSL